MRAAIERDLAAGVPTRIVGQKYGISRDACWRWLKKMPPHLKAEKYIGLIKAEGDLERLRIEESEGLLANLAMQRARLLMAQDAALELADLMCVNHIAGQIHRNLELVGKYLGEFASHSISTSVSLLITPEYLDLRAALVRALRPSPQARAAVAAVLRDVETTAARRVDEASRATPANVAPDPHLIEHRTSEAADA